MGDSTYVIVYGHLELRKIKILGLRTYSHISTVTQEELGEEGQNQTVVSESQVSALSEELERCRSIEVGS